MNQQRKNNQSKLNTFGIYFFFCAKPQKKRFIKLFKTILYCRNRQKLNKMHKNTLQNQKNIVNCNYKQEN